TRLPAMVAVVLALMLLGAGCAAKRQTSGASSTPSASAGPPVNAPVLRPPRVETGPVWQIEPRTLAAPHPATVPVLTAFRVLQHKIHDRIEFDFSGSFGTVEAHYVPVVRADPSGTP